MQQSSLRHRPPSGVLGVVTAEAAVILHDRRALLEGFPPCMELLHSDGQGTAYTADREPR
jgi:hypothetical protein